MSKKIDLKKQPTPINLVDWIGLYDSEFNGNYALEFLTAVTYNDLSISDAERYQLPSDVEDKDLDPKKRESIKRWEQGEKPRAIKGLDELRKIKNPEFRLDLLKPRLYNGTEITGNNLPYAIDILPGLVYLYISVLISGCSTEDNSYSQFNPKGKITIYPSRRLPRKDLEAKLQGVYTENRGRAEIGLKQPYAHLLQLLGMPQGKIVELDYEELGLDFIEKLILWTKKERLNKSDNKHAMNALYKVIEAFIDQLEEG